MITVDETQLDQVEYLIEQSIKGNHILFDRYDIKLAFSQNIDTSRSREIEKHIEALILRPTLVQKRAYLEKLDEGTYLKVMRSFFSIVDNSLLEHSTVRH